MIAHGAKHPPLQLPKVQVVGEPADVHFGVVEAIRIAANDKQLFLAVISHVGQQHRNGLVVEQKVRDCAGHRLSKRERGA